MTDDKRSQEAEDVALETALERLYLRAAGHFQVSAFNAVARPILARLVREGQIRVLLLVAADQCFACGGKWDEFVAKPVLGQWWSTRWEHPMRGREEPHIGAQCLAPKVHAHIAALRWDRAASRGRLLGLLGSVGGEFPELRLCQLIVNATSNDPFNVTDEALADALIRYRDTHDSTESPR